MTYAQRIPQRFDDAAPCLVRVPLARMDDGRPLDAGTMECIANNAAHLGRENSRRVLFAAASPLLESNKWVNTLGGSTQDNPVATPGVTYPPHEQPWGLGLNAIACQYAPTTDAYDAGAPSVAWTRRLKVTTKTTSTNSAYVMVVLTTGWQKPFTAPGNVLAEVNTLLTSGTGIVTEIEVGRVALPRLAMWPSPRTSSVTPAPWPSIVAWVGFNGSALTTLTVDSISISELRDPDGAP